MKLASAFVRCVAFALLALTPMAAQADTPAQKVVLACTTNWSRR